MESERRYRSFDWGRCGEWQSYLANIFPSPTLVQVQRIRRRWYQRHIDPSLPSDAPPSDPAPPASAPQRRAASQRALTLLELALFVLVGVPVGIQHKTLHILAAGFFADIVRKQGPPTLAAGYWSRAARESELMSVAYCLLFLIYAKGATAALPAYCNAAALTIQICCSSPVIPEVIKSASQRLERLRPWIITWQYRIELIQIPILLVLSILTWSNFLLVPLYLYLLAVRISVKTESGEAVRELKACGDAVCRKWRWLERPWRSTVEQCAKLGCKLTWPIS